MRITLGRLQAADTLAVSVAMMDPRVSGWLRTFPYPYAEVPRGAEDGPPATADWAVRADGRFVGIVLAAPELGCWIDSKFQGKGIATRASVLALTRLFASGVRYSYARFLPENLAMKAMLDRLGFRPDTSIPSSVTRPDLGLLRLCWEDFCLAQPVVLQGPRIRVSPIRQPDLAALHGIATDSAVSANLPFVQPGMTPEDLGRALTSFQGRAPFWCKLRMGQQIIGAIGLESGLLDDQDVALVRIFVTPSLRDPGVGAEALGAFLCELHDRFALRDIQVECFSDDARLAVILGAAGFVQDGPEYQLTTPQRVGMAARFSAKADD